MKYDVVIGIETHIQLKSATKMFCRCSADFFGVEPNSHTCPTCLGLPGGLPVANKFAIEQAILTGLALHGEIATESAFDRKNYFYPDLAKGYQISQYDKPLVTGGWVSVDGEKIGLIRAHLEEDVGKLAHTADGSAIDFNKGGVPLLEIVSEPVITSAAQAKRYVQTLRQLVRYIGVNDGNLERGTMRADINISLQEAGKYYVDQGSFVVADGYRLNNRVEVKNVNSFRSIERAVEYEIRRQQEQLEAGREIIQETRGWDEASGKTTGLRGKEEAHDYRYFPEPDLPPLRIDRPWVDAIASRLPELPGERIGRLQQQYRLGEYEARLLAEEKATADWFESAVSDYAGRSLSGTDNSRVAKSVANWMLGEVARLQNEHQKLLTESALSPAQLIDVMQLVDGGKISGTSAKQLVAELFVNGGSATDLVQLHNMKQVSDDEALRPVIEKVLLENEDAVANYRAGKEAALMFLVGQVMRHTKGTAKPEVVKRLIGESIS
jgi:aspartyl-tRNA(Asn)/glutamyl-tRNA(Gln) amidotransferase subunit B